MYSTLSSLSKHSRLLLHSDGSPIQEGDIIYRPKFANTLEKIAIGGADDFYRGQLAEDIVKDIQESGMYYYNTGSRNWGTPSPLKFSERGHPPKILRRKKYSREE